MSKKPSVAFLTHDWSLGINPIEPSGCAWYRCKLPSDELKKHGWTSTVGFPGFSETNGFGLMLSNGDAIHGWDIIVFKLLMHREVLEGIPKAKALGQKIVVDIDDAHDELDKANKAYYLTSKEFHPDYNREIYAQIIMAADAVITSTPYLFNYYASKRNNVYMVLNGIDLPRWKRNKFKKNKHLNIGWVGATNYRSRDLQELSGFIGQYIKERKLGFTHSGHQEDAIAANLQLGISHEYVAQLKPLVPISKYPSLFKDIDIGIAPLRDIPFNHAKSYIKGLEYAAAGIPFVATNIAEYATLAASGVGRVAITADEWIYHLDELLNTSKRKDEIEVNYENLQNFTMEKRGHDWDATLRHMLENL
jgi:hypothetical protein